MYKYANICLDQIFVYEISTVLFSTIFTIL